MAGQSITRLHNVDGRPGYPVDFKPGETEAFFILVRAKGNPATPGADAPSEQPRVVSFKYGIPIGQTLIGADFAIESMEMVGRGELVYNWQEHQFPLHSDSPRWRESTSIPAPWQDTSPS